MAVTFSTLNELAPGRLLLGLGAYWDPLAWKQGIKRTKPLTQMREYVSVLRRLLALEEGVTLEGEVVHVRDLTLDLGHGAPRNPIRVPIYIGATGEKMMELSGEVADGILLNGLTPPDHTRRSLEAATQGARRAGRTLADLDLPQIVNVSMAKDRDRARAVSKRLVTMYLGQQPHIAKASGLAEAELARIHERLGGWPPRPGGLDAAIQLVPDDVVDRLTVRRALGRTGLAGASIREANDAAEAIASGSPARTSTEVSSAICAMADDSRRSGVRC
jgi:5,10-methylenetetrahydromethanopterin reductase